MILFPDIVFMLGCLELLLTQHVSSKTEANVPERRNRTKKNMFSSSAVGLGSS